MAFEPNNRNDFFSHKKDHRSFVQFEFLIMKIAVTIDLIIEKRPFKKVLVST